ncbi:hypothetical protein COX05_01020 [candidate division WWE3 bacterium CG22_combo_CG10-13_8_21_14_all_39_12]|uniref:Uncharacterized protein n=1 Tax=candidate division WWE3 bacterium CG22_combo_CG10-13_8_21_14_all_39_12 TaxID=1975094 RepID=A0A2H0BIG8_UNCKA|nr:MAG: hypothetical protein COX05_01020 [candidate division WWE3 bacterium CG22_combo_CG10-13_8_21_14_all_39_12]
MQVPSQLSTVTTVSKIIAAILFILLPFVGFYAGTTYQKQLDKPFIILVPSPIPKNNEILTISQILDNPTLYLDETIQLRVKTKSRLVCTERACGPDIECCNTCSGSIYLLDIDNTTNNPQLPLKGENISCSGMDCNITCTTIQPNEEYLITGIFHQIDHSYGPTYELEYLSHTNIAVSDPFYCTNSNECVTYSSDNCCGLGAINQDYLEEYNQPQICERVCPILSSQPVCLNNTCTLKE